MHFKICRSQTLYSLKQDKIRAANYIYVDNYDIVVKNILYKYCIYKNFQIFYPMANKCKLIV